MLLKIGLALSVRILQIYAGVINQQPLLVDEGVAGHGRLRQYSVKESHDQLKLLKWAQNYGLDVWRATESEVDIYIPAATEVTSVPPWLSSYSYSESAIAVPSTSQYFSGADQSWELLSFGNSTYHGAYHPLREIDDFMRDMSNLHGNYVRIIPLGHSGEGREMFAFEIAKDGIGNGEKSQSVSDEKEGMLTRKKKKNDTHVSPKPGFVIMGAQHAREWVATATSLYLAHALVANASESHSLNHLLDKFTFYVIPVPNPDGYDYTWETDRLWYKNRMILGPNAKCTGLDMNRNWGYKWKSVVFDELSSGSKKGKSAVADPCSHWYPGSRPFQAPEVNNIANYVASLPNLKAFVDLRSYGQMLSAPYSHSCTEVAKDAEDQLEAALGAVQAIKKSHGVSFKAGTLCSLLYRAPGNVVDWMYQKAGIKYSYAVHLRDTGTYGFSLPPEWIRPVGEETGAMIAYLAEFIARVG